MHDLVVSDIVKEYPTRFQPLVVLRGCTLALSAGENLAIVGPSGSGKSTLLYIIGTLDRPTSGGVVIRGEDPFRYDERRLAHFRNATIGFVFQDHYLLPQCTVLENVLVPTIAAGGASREVVERARSLVERVGLGDRLEHRPAELSGGERQRVAIARALVHKPALLLADEPTGNLDRSTATRVAELLIELQSEEQAMLIVVTHSAELAGRMQRCLELDDGRLVAIEPSRPADPSSRA